MPSSSNASSHMIGESSTSATANTQSGESSSAAHSSNADPSTRSTATSYTSPTEPTSPNPLDLEETRAMLSNMIESSGNAYSTRLQERVNDISTNMSAIEKQEAELFKNSTALEKDVDALRKELDKATGRLNARGDLQNWAELMEQDFLVLEETLRLVEGGDEPESASGGSQWK